MADEADKEGLVFASAIGGKYHCPECSKEYGPAGVGVPFAHHVSNAKGEYLTCANADCPLKGKKYRIPKVVLVELEDGERA